MLEQTRETVLVVDDEPVTRRWLSSVLLDEGYMVLQASDGVDALDVANGHPEKTIALLVTDIRMPRMAGPELAEHMRAMRPSIKVLFISSEAVHPEDLPALRGEFLEKTFISVTFATKVREVLDLPTEL